MQILGRIILFLVFLINYSNSMASTLIEPMERIDPRRAFTAECRAAKEQYGFYMENSDLGTDLYINTCSFGSVMSSQFTKLQQKKALKSNSKVAQLAISFDWNKFLQYRKIKKSDYYLDSYMWKYHTYASDHWQNEAAHRQGGVEHVFQQIMLNAQPKFVEETLYYFFNPTKKICISQVSLYPGEEIGNLDDWFRPYSIEYWLPIRPLFFKLKKSAPIFGFYLLTSDEVCDSVTACDYLCVPNPWLPYKKTHELFNVIRNSNDNVEVVNKYLKAGNTQFETVLNLNSWTPLHEAALWGYKKVFYFLQTAYGLQDRYVSLNRNQEFLALEILKRRAMPKKMYHFENKKIRFNSALQYLDDLIQHVKKHKQII